MTEITAVTVPFTIKGLRTLRRSYWNKPLTHLNFLMVKADIAHLSLRTLRRSYWNSALTFLHFLMVKTDRHGL